MKQTIKLKESQLRNIIKECIINVLNEGQLNELDPRTYASYAQKRAAQGQAAKATAGRMAARDAWNKQYGYDDSQYNGFGDRFDSKQYMGDANDEYSVHTSNQQFNGNNGYVNANGRSGAETVYNPNTNTAQRSNWQYDASGKEISNNTQNIKGIPSAPYGSKPQIGRQVAQQMAQGTGHFNKQTGKWD